MTPQVVLHTQPWIPLHGGWVIEKGDRACLDCHKISSETSETAPTCFSCHSGYPHVEGWAQKENHGAYVLREGKNSCALCHGADLKGEPPEFRVTVVMKFFRIPNSGEQLSSMVNLLREVERISVKVVMETIFLVVIVV
ncbi:MAG: hypothetical protein IPJ69_10945 [Deltaproteobacteria bacterium]|nr:MAG: hypothetical protein IPJ69_10945 [Deltaproteobacteria bacterium]